MEAESLLGALRSMLEQEASIPALRAFLFLFGICGALAWFRGAPRLALSLIVAGGFFGLSFWFVQIRAPFGLGTDAELTRQWAQAGVNAVGKTPGSGFVWGTDEEPSLIGALATAGLPTRFVFWLPQTSALLSLVVLTLLPLMLIRSRTAAAFAASLAAAGGLWPGISHYGSLLLRPSLLVVLAGASGAAILLARRSRIRRGFNRSRPGLAAALIAAAALLRAIAGDAESGTLAPLLLLAASIALASPLRAFLRQASSSQAGARGLEAFGLLAIFTGSGLFWFDPPATLKGFSESRMSGAALRRPLQWIAQNVPLGDVILASAPYSASIAAFGGRRVLFPVSGDESRAGPLKEPLRRARLLESTLQGRPVERLAAAFSVTHLFLGPGEVTPPATETMDAVEEPVLRLVLVYQDVEDFRLFRLAKK